MVDQEGQESGPKHEELDLEGVLVTANGSLVLNKHQEYVGEGAEDEEDLDGSVV